ncbi:MAG: phosphotransferase [Nitrospirota bacterium]
MQIKSITSLVGFLGEFLPGGIPHDSKNEKYSILPSVKNPRWIVPVFDKKLFISSLALYQPSLLRAKILKQLAILTARGGFTNIGKKPAVYFRKNDDAIKKIFGRDDLYYAIFLGTEGCHKKITIQVMNSGGDILGYIKVSGNKDVDELLKNEAGILEDMRNLSLNNGLFPEVLYHGPVKGVDILVLDTLKSAHSKYDSNLSDAHIDFLAEIFLKTSMVIKYRESKFAKRLKERVRDLEVEKLRNSEDERLRELGKIRDFIEEKIGNELVPFGLCHRDFTPWNTFFHDGRLYVFDWEYAEREYPPMLDIFHFIVQDGILVRHLKPAGLLKRVMKNEKMLSKYSSLVGIRDELSMPLLLCYLLDISLLYIEREKGRIEGNIKHMLDTWAGMMELIRGDG